MAQDVGQMAEDGLRSAVTALDQEDAVEMARQSLTGRGITPSKDWHVRDGGSCWVIQNLPVVRLLVRKDTGQVLCQESPGM